MGQGDWLVVGAVGWLGGDAHPPPHSHHIPASPIEGTPMKAGRARGEWLGGGVVGWLGG